MSEFTVEDIYRLKEELNIAIEKAVNMGYRVDVHTIPGHSGIPGHIDAVTKISLDVYKYIPSKI